MSFPGKIGTNFLETMPAGFLALYSTMQYVRPLDFTAVPPIGTSAHTIKYLLGELGISNILTFPLP